MPSPTSWELPNRDSETSSTFSLLSPQQQDRLAGILDEYLTAIEHGKPVTPADLLARYPEDADLLRDYLNGLQIFHDAAGGVPGGQTKWTPRQGIDDRAGETLGDYRLIREVGRGGMGIVYEAWQISLRRRVALKILPLAGADIARHIARFKNEAHAAAQLHHPNIVPVYSVGKDRGIHYYAMQFIDGDSLASLLCNTLTGGCEVAETSDQVKAFHDPDGTAQSQPVLRATRRVDLPTRDTPLTKGSTAEHIRRIAILGTQAADALHSAHSDGVIHRDIKPSNLLVDEDQKLWVTDFGLARCRDTSNLTKTGDVVGTMRYMSPEQTVGDSPFVDHRSDVFSLGVTLFELATLRHPAESNVGASLVCDPARYHLKSLKSLNPHIHVDFQTIILKAMAEAPPERYSNAHELAEDLRRFVRGEPIRATPPRWWTRATKWANRHQIALFGSVATLLILTLATAVGLGIVVQAKQQKVSALQDADQQRQHAERNLRQALEVLDRLGADFSEQLASVPGAEGIRHQLLKESVAFYEDLAQDSSTSPLLRRDLSMAYAKIGDLKQRLGDKEDAIRSLTSAATLLESLHGDHPDVQDHTVQLVHTWNKLALLLAASGRDLEARALVKEAQLQLEKFPDHAGRTRDIQLPLATTLVNLALFDGKAGDHAGAERELNEAVNIYRALLDIDINDDASRRSLGLALNQLATLHATTNPQLARREYTSATEILNMLTENQPLDARYQEDQALVAINMSFLLAQGPELELAEGTCQDAIRNLNKLHERAPLVASYRANLAIAHNNLGMIYSRGENYDQATAAFRRAIQWQTELLAEHTADTKLSSDLGGMFHNLAELHANQGQWAGATTYYERAIRYQEGALMGTGQQVAGRLLLDRHFAGYIGALQQQCRWRESLEAARRQKNLYESDPEHLLAVARELAAPLDRRDIDEMGDRMALDGHRTAALEALREALNLGLSADRLRALAAASGLKSPQFAHLLAELVRVPLQSTGMDDGSTQQGL